MKIFKDNVNVFVSVATVNVNIINILKVQYKLFLNKFTKLQQIVITNDLTSIKIA